LPPGQVVIYDSLSFSPNSFVVGSVASLIQTQETFFTLQLATTSKQINNYDCGVYAIAFATALIFDTDPSKITFDSQNMRQHLIEYFTQQILTSFPSLNLLYPFKEKLPAQIVQVYCLCRRPLRFRLGKNAKKEEKLTQCELCNDCFHRSCLASCEIFKVKNWRCQKCVNY
jgi:polycystin 1L2